MSSPICREANATAAKGIRNGKVFARIVS